MDGYNNFWKFVFLFCFFKFFVSRALLHRLYVKGSISTKSTKAPQYKPQFAEATKELVEVHNMSFF